MRLQGRRKSDNVIDLAGGDAPPRRRPGKKAAVGGGLGLLVLVVVALLGGGDLSQLLGQLGSQVAAGDTLLVLQETASLASRDQIIQEIATLSASVLRLTALQDEEPSLDF
ncbi:MAG: neutral zinc metallopeptidase, partial [Planctomycetota bacterium]